jgi:hypothetical protein
MNVIRFFNSFFFFLLLPMIAFSAVTRTNNELDQKVALHKMPDDILTTITFFSIGLTEEELWQTLENIALTSKRLYSCMQDLIKTDFKMRDSRIPGINLIRIIFFGASSSTIQLFKPHLESYSIIDLSSAHQALSLHLDQKPHDESGRQVLAKIETKLTEKLFASDRHAKISQALQEVLHFASEHNSKEILTLLITTPRIAEGTYLNRFAIAMCLELAAHQGHRDLIEFLLNNSYVQTHQLITPLSFFVIFQGAVAGRQVEFLKWLLSSENTSITVSNQMLQNISRNNPTNNSYIKSLLTQELKRRGGRTGCQCTIL